MEKVDEIFISCVFNEFEEEVLELEKAIEESLVFRKLNVSGKHFAKNATYSKILLGNSISLLKAASYVVILIGQEIGTETGDGKSYLEHEIDAAYEAGNLTVYTYIRKNESANGTQKNEVGSKKRIGVIVNNLPENLTRIDVKTNDANVLARNIVRDIEKDIFYMLDEADSCLEQSKEIKYSYEAEYHLVLNYLSRALDEPDFVIKAATMLAKIFKASSKYYFEIERKVESQFPYLHSEITMEVSKQLNVTFSDIYKSYKETESWAKQGFDLRTKNFSKLNKKASIFKQTYNVSVVIFNQHKLLCEIMGEIILDIWSALYQKSQRLIEINKYKNKIELEKAYNILLPERLNMLNKCKDSLWKLEEKESSLLRNIKLTRWLKNIGGSVTVTIFVLLILSLIGAVQEIVQAFSLYMTVSIALVLTLLFKKTGQKLSEKAKNIVHYISMARNDFEMAVEKLEKIRLLGMFHNNRKLNSKVGTIFFERQTEETVKDLSFESLVDQNFVFELEKQQNINSNNLKSICLRIDNFEEFVVTIHKGQYCNLLCKNKGLKRVINSKDSRSIYDVLLDNSIEEEVEKESHSNLVKNNCRVSAWLDDNLSSKRVIMDLLRTDDDEIDRPRIGEVKYQELSNLESETVQVNKIFVEEGEFVIQGDKIFSIIDKDVERIVSSEGTGYVEKLFVSIGENYLLGTLVLAIIHLPSKNNLFEKVKSRMKSY